MGLDKDKIAEAIRQDILADKKSIEAEIVKAVNAVKEEFSSATDEHIIGRMQRTKNEVVKVLARRELKRRGVGVA